MFRKIARLHCVGYYVRRIGAADGLALHHSLMYDQSEKKGIEETRMHVLKV